MSERTAVYRLFDDIDTLLYIGESADPDEREGWHRATQSWGRQIHHRTDEWHDRLEEALRAETAAIEAERPLHNVANSPWRPIPGPDGRLVAVTKAEYNTFVLEEKSQQPRRPADAEPITWMTPPQIAALTDPPTSRHTVERAIKSGKLAAERVGAQWIVDQREAERWAGQFRLYAGLRKPAS